jgi:hypothetical protein
MIFFALLPPQVHELGYADCPKSYVFRGDKAVSPQQVRFFSVFPPLALLYLELYFPA